MTAEAYEQAKADRLGFWAEQAKRLTWATEPTETLDWSNPPFAKWFADGELNVAYNCVDRHVEAGHGDRVAIHFEGEPGDSRAITYAELKDEVSRAANALTELGVRKGDRVAVYLPMIPEAAVTMLACARVGAAHSVVFGGFSADAVASRIQDADAKLVVTADGGYRRSKPSALKPAIDEAVAKCPQVEHVLVVRRTGQDTAFTEGRDVWWDDIVARQSAEHTPEAFEAEHPSSSSTPRAPRGSRRASCTPPAATSPRPPTPTTPSSTSSRRATSTGAPPTSAGSPGTRTSSTARWPTARRRSCTRAPRTPAPGPVLGDRAEVRRHDPLHGADRDPHVHEVGRRHPREVRPVEPARPRLGRRADQPEAWVWYREHIGAGKTPIVDTWWQTETGAMMISPLPGVTETKPGSAQRPLPGIAATVVDDEANEVPNGGGGYLVLTEPWPSMLRTIWGDDQRYIDTYWSRFEGKYFAGDGAKKDEDGDIWLLGRVDDVMLVSGHNISTTEVESALVSHPAVAEAAVVGAADETTSQAIVAFVILRGTATQDDNLVAELRNHVGATLGPIAKPKRILPVAELPKTRSGKIMRRLLRDVAENRELGDVTTLTDSSVMSLIQTQLPATSSED